LVRVILVRHGETDWNVARRIQGGGSDTPLNERGNRQKDCLALRLKGENIGAVYSSPLKRALDTAQAIARYHNLEVVVEPSLREIDVGELEGASVLEMGKHLDEVLTGHGQGMPRMPGGESIQHVQTRVWGTVKRLAEKYPDGTLVVVSHYFAILSVICSVLNMPLSQLGRFRMSAASISTIAFEGDVTRLMSFNDTCHLDGV
jgi:probable phosphoglycerate mutase